MIRYLFTEDELVADIQADDKLKKRKVGWLKTAKILTAKLRRNSKKKITSQWSGVKSVYTKRQHGKCAFCERLLGEHELSSVEFDVEHFRPKNAVKPWPSPDLIKELRLPSDFPKSTGKGKGYRLLAYHHLNYASSCKTCNSRLKANFFPIAGKHSFTGHNPVSLYRLEKPYLVYPLCDFDKDPEDLIAFRGYRAEPCAPKQDRFNHDRGRVIIAFFRLNDERDDLLLLRAKQLDYLFTKLELYNIERNDDRRAEIWEDIERLASERNDHAGCVRHLLRRYGDRDAKPPPPSRAEALEDLCLARDYVRSKLPSIRPTIAVSRGPIKGGNLSKRKTTEPASRQTIRQPLASL